MKILVADNNRTITRIVKTALTEEGYSVEVANSKEDTLKIFKGNPDIEIVLLDTKFETDKDGYRLAKELKKIREAHIVMLVSALEKPDIELMKNVGADSYLTKPIDSRKLLQIISEIENMIRTKKTEKEEEEVEVQNIKETKEQKIEERVEEQRIETDEGSEEEKGIISYDWKHEEKSKMMDEILMVLSSVREIFENIKSIEKEAQGYVREMSQIIPEFRNKIQNIPSPDKIISQVIQEIMGEVQKKIQDLYDRVIREVRNEVNLALHSEIEKMKTEIKDSTLSYIENEFSERIIDKIRSSIYDQLHGSIYQSIKDEVDRVLGEFRNELQEAKDELQRTKVAVGDIEKKVSEMELKEVELGEEKLEETAEQYSENQQTDFISIEDI